MRHDRELTRARIDNLRADYLLRLRTLFERRPTRMFSRRLKLSLGGLLVIAYALVHAS